MPEAKGYTPSFNRLLPDTDGHLRDIDEGPLRTRNHHLLDVVVFFQVLLRVLAGRITSQVELSLDSTLERFTDSHTRCGFEPGMTGVINDLLDISLPLCNMLGDVGHRSLISDRVTDAYAEAVME